MTDQQPGVERQIKSGFILPDLGIAIVELESGEILQLEGEALKQPGVPELREIERCYAFFRTQPDENDGKEFFFSALWHNDTIEQDGERIVPGWFLTDEQAALVRTQAERLTAAERKEDELRQVISTYCDEVDGLQIERKQLQAQLTAALERCERLEGALNEIDEAVLGTLPSTFEVKSIARKALGRNHAAEIESLRKSTYIKCDSCGCGILARNTKAGTNGRLCIDPTVCVSKARDVDAVTADNAELRKRAEDAEATVKGVAGALGWMNIPPQSVLEMDIGSLKVRCHDAKSAEAALAAANKQIAELRGVLEEIVELGGCNCEGGYCGTCLAAAALAKLDTPPAEPTQAE